MWTAQWTAAGWVNSIFCDCLLCRRKKCLQVVCLLTSHPLSIANRLATVNFNRPPSDAPPKRPPAGENSNSCRVLRHFYLPRTDLLWHHKIPGHIHFIWSPLIAVAPPSPQTNKQKPHSTTNHRQTSAWGESSFSVCVDRTWTKWPYQLPIINLACRSLSILHYHLAIDSNEVDKKNEKTFCQCQEEIK